MELAIANSRYTIAVQGSSASLLAHLLAHQDQRGVPLGDYDSERRLGRKIRYLSDATRLFGGTACALLDDAAIKAMADTAPQRIGIYVCAETVNLRDDYNFDSSVKVNGPDEASPLTAPSTLANVVGSHFASFTGITGPNCTIAAGPSSGAHALQTAMHALTEQAIDCAFVGGVEVSSDYHRAAFDVQREVGVVHAVVAAAPDAPVVFFAPRLGMREQPDAVDLAQALKREAEHHFGRAALDAVIIASGASLLDTDRLCTALSQLGVSGTVLPGERLYGQGESCSGLLALGLAHELLAGAPAQWQSVQAHLLGTHDVTPRRLGIVSLDEQGQFSAGVMEKRA